MTFDKFVILYCDKEGCTVTPLHTGYTSLPAARRYAREIGWTSIRQEPGVTFDFCHRHGAT